MGITSDTLLAFGNVVCIPISTGSRKKHMVPEDSGSESPENVLVWSSIWIYCCNSFG